MKDEKDLEADAGGGSGEKGSKMSRSSSPGPAGTSKAKTDEDEGRHGEIKADEPTVIKDEQGGRDEEPGLGVDSNAPLPDESKAADSNGKVKAEGDDGDNVEEGAIEIDDDARPGTDEAKEPQEDDERVKKKPKRGGQEIKVTRRPEEAKTDVSCTFDPLIRIETPSVLKFQEDAVEDLEEGVPELPQLRMMADGVAVQYHELFQLASKGQGRGQG
jgi:hypothetical protein